MSSVVEQAAAPVAVSAAIARPLDFLPVAMFGSVMGLTGLSVAWRAAQGVFGAPAWIATGIGAVAVIAFVVLVIGYGVKIGTVPDKVLAEFRHPIAGNLFGTVLISLLLLPLVIVPYSPAAARAVWVVGAVGMTLFAWLIVNRWLSSRQLVAHATPAWVVPVVGLLDLPLAVPSLGLPPLHGVMVFGLAAGLFFAVPIFTLIFSRLLFDEPLPAALRPSLMILLAPFAVGFSTYTTVVGQVDVFAQSLYVLTLFMLALLLSRLRHLRVCPFRVSWWAISFPLAAAAVAGLKYAAYARDGIADAIAVALLAFATVVIAGLLARTLLGLARGELRTLSA